MKINDIIKENNERHNRFKATFNPITGEGSIGERQPLHLSDYPLPTQYLPVDMFSVPLVEQLQQAGSIRRFLRQLKASTGSYDDDRAKVIDCLVRLRSLYDFPFWAALFVYIKNKGGGDDILFRLNYPQRILIDALEKQRLAGQPIRLLLLKARQWGGSTAIQVYIMWLQTMHKTGLNSLIIAQQTAATDEIKNMFNRAIAAYPLYMLHQLGESYDPEEPKIESASHSGTIHYIPQRNCNIKIGTAERPDSCRGGDYNLVHLSEVALWKTTEGKKPEDIVRSACSGVLLQPYTLIIYESTANGTGNFFCREYTDAKEGRSQFHSLFIAWFNIPQYALPIDDINTFARTLYDNRNHTNVASAREESGQYLWHLFTLGATLEAINWYIQERKKFNDHSLMAAEYPSDDVEAFAHSGAQVFDRYKVELLRPSCRPPLLIGEVAGKSDEGANALKDIHFTADHQGLLHIWEQPEEDTPTNSVTNRYLAVVDVGGRSAKADFSVVVVFDRLFMIESGQPVVVAQWYGHCDIDRLAWRACQIAAYYNNALLVVESNTFETHNPQSEGDQSHFILNQIKDIYPNLYARAQSQEDIQNHIPRKYGFHTNVATKPMIVSNLVRVIRDSLYIERDERCLDEYLYYEKKRNGSFGAIAGKHDDLLMTRAIGLHICLNEMPLPCIVDTTHTSAARHRQTSVTEATI